MTQRSCLSIILAAGEGTRMKSARPKVLHEIAGLPMVAHVAAAAKKAGGDVALVIGHGADEVRKAAGRLEPAPEIFVQEERLGTAHAVLAARAAIARGYDDVLVMFGDAPLIEAEPLLAARAKLAEGAAVVVVGFRPADPSIPIGAPVDPAHGVDPKQPQTLLELPDAATLEKLLDVWKKTKKASDIILVVDKSGSMEGKPLAEAKVGAKAFLDILHDRDEVTLYAWLDAGIVVRGAQAPFSLRSQRNRPRAAQAPQAARAKAKKKAKRKTSIKRQRR